MPEEFGRRYAYGWEFESADRGYTWECTSLRSEDLLRVFEADGGDEG